MKRLLIIVPFYLLAAVLVCQAQNRERFVISAKAGGVNSVSGQVTVRRSGEKDWQALTSKDDLATGDVVRTGASGLAEVLLNPGTYLRLPGNSELELTDASLDNLKVRLVEGSAIVEAAGQGGGDLLITFLTPQTRVAIVKKGVYRINVRRAGETEVIVRNGRALVGVEQLKVKGGNKALVQNNSPVALAKYDKKEQDQFDLWSKERAETLAQANRKLSERALNGFFGSYSERDWANLYDSGRYGIWLFNPRSGYYTFLPFAQGFGSPYGHSYITSIYSPWPINSPYYGGGGPGRRGTVNPFPRMPGGGNPGGGSGGGSGGGGGPVPVSPTPTRAPAPDGGRPVRPSHKGVPDGD